ncbi:MAG: isoprenylcysteine carboxylmethyltransferase family protein [Nitrospirae bacterium]|nr:isoprenylcysteine carboxylmethyltransferase family protein [Nitrospirota bacterium]
MKSTLSWNAMKRKVTAKTIPVYLLAIGLVWLAKPVPVTFVAGLVVVVAGEAIRIWAAGHLYKNERVTTSGPYAYVKNPLYLGTLLIMVGLCVMASNYVLLVIGLAVFVAYYAPFKQRRESDRLRERFGESWVQYDREVPGYLPRLTPYPGRDRLPWQWEAFIRNDEHGTAMAVGVGIAVLAWKLWG